MQKTVQKTVQKTLVILGGYGNFGKRIAKYFKDDNDTNNIELTIYIAGRNLLKAQGFCLANNNKKQNKNKQVNYQPFVIDIYDPQFKSKLSVLNPDILIHTSGPFQGQTHFVAQTCVELNCHYIDLADDRRFVCDINQLDEQAKQNAVLVVSGASSVPGVSIAVVANLVKQFKKINSIDLAIAPGNKAERGRATLKAILSYTGKAFLIFKDSKWQNGFGWMDSRKVDFKYGIGKRSLANVDVPDLEILPALYSEAKTITFQAGLELNWLHNIMCLMAKMAKMKWIKNWDKYTGLIFYMACKLESFGSADGAMRIQIKGLSLIDQPQTVTWTLVAKDGIGPFIPTFASIILVKKILKNQINQTGATACVNLFSKQEFEKFALTFGIPAYLDVENNG
ncbi:MAG: saccharopine dehydrogenase NADP-binding domain-containing protein [Saccharospirillaceae bacterium]|nr:saccharopine dehydrogenase NADP-binding domain-containing protein [Pseudomonadales bacterium]NRB79320.1 saccharopine dehydrogenase NADP-binding domain-containing protein [Saccharospirillaceae bacterium]